MRATFLIQILQILQRYHELWQRMVLLHEVLCKCGTIHRQFDKTFYLPPLPILIPITFAYLKMDEFLNMAHSVYTFTCSKSNLLSRFCGCCRE